MTTNKVTKNVPVARKEEARPVDTKPTNTAVLADADPRERKGVAVRSDELRQLALELDQANLAANPGAVISHVATRLREIAG